jgi:hypothetical protein
VLHLRDFVPHISKHRPRWFNNAKSSLLSAALVLETS